MNNLKTICKYFSLFVFGGGLYYFIELIWRGWSHWSMFFVGGICFVLIGLINNLFTWTMSMPTQMLAAAIIITGVEFFAGCILNLWLHLEIWDYTTFPHNLCGQVCLSYFALWQGLSIVGIILDDYIRWHSFGEEKPRYRWL